MIGLRYFAFIVLCGLASAANAAIVQIGSATYASAPNAAGNTSLSLTENEYKLLHDDVNMITWLDYSFSGNAATNSGSKTWAATLNSELTINLNEGYSASWDSADWRLSEASGTLNTVTSSEMKELYYSALGNELNDAMLNFGDFNNLVAGFYHLQADAALEPVLGLSFSPWFNFSNGTQGIGSSSVNGGIYAIAVISGEVSLVPIPAGVWLFGSGLIGLIRVARRKAIS